MKNYYVTLWMDNGESEWLICPSIITAPNKELAGQWAMFAEAGYEEEDLKDFDWSNPREVVFLEFNLRIHMIEEIEDPEDIKVFEKYYHYKCEFDPVVWLMKDIKE